MERQTAVLLPRCITDTVLYCTVLYCTRYGSGWWLVGVCTLREVIINDVSVFSRTPAVLEYVEIQHNGFLIDFVPVLGLR